MLSQSNIDTREHTTSQLPINTKTAIADRRRSFPSKRLRPSLSGVFGPGCLLGDVYEEYRAPPGVFQKGYLLVLGCGYLADL